MFCFGGGGGAGFPWLEKSQENLKFFKVRNVSEFNAYQEKLRLEQKIRENSGSFILHYIFILKTAIIQESQN